MNKIGFTHCSIGNHEFDLSVKTLLQRIHEAKFKGGRPLFPQSLRFPIRDFNVVLFSLVVVNSNISSLEGTVPSDVVTVSTRSDLFRS